MKRLSLRVERVHLLSSCRVYRGFGRSCWAISQFEPCIATVREVLKSYNAHKLLRLHVVFNWPTTLENVRAIRHHTSLLS